MAASLLADRSQPILRSEAEEAGKCVVAPDEGPLGWVTVETDDLGRGPTAGDLQQSGGGELPGAVPHVQPTKQPTDAISVRGLLAGQRQDVEAHGAVLGHGKRWCSTGRKRSPRATADPLLSMSNQKKRTRSRGGGGLADLFCRSKATEAELEGLNEQQSRALQALLSGDNVFLTGPPGTGKSHVLRRGVPALRSRGLEVAVTSLTGSAALLVGGRTLHSVLGLGLGRQPAAKIVRNLQKRRAPALPCMRAMDVLVIDEVSMLSRELFELADEVMRRVLHRHEPFGGVQVVLVGDFCQLPPVQGAFCFDCPLWTALDLRPAQLQEVVRQKGDRPFQKVLADVRFGDVPVDAAEMLRARLGQRFQGRVQPTHLFPRRAQADDVNQAELDLLVGMGAHHMAYHRRASNSKSETYADTHGIPGSVRLAVGAQVVITRNLDQELGIVNGTRGVVRELRPLGVDIELLDGKLQRVGFVESRAEGNDPISVLHMPLQLAYVLTIHRAQGMTLDCVQMDLGKSVFAVGQAYTALSRARCLQSIVLLDFDEASFRVDPVVKEFYRKLSCPT